MFLDEWSFGGGKVDGFVSADEFLIFFLEMR